VNHFTGNKGYQRFMREALRQYLEDALNRNERNVVRTAREVGVNRCHFYKLARKVGLTIRNYEKPGAQRMTPEFRRFLGMEMR